MTLRRTGTLLTAGVFLLGGCTTTVSLRNPSTTVTVRSAPPTDDDHLAKAAACLDRGDEPAALPHLVAHVQARPDAVMIRAYLAELLLKLGREDESRRHFERYTRDAAGLTGQPQRHLVHCHTRLMEIAERRNDPFGESLHRGIGLVLLVRQWDAEPDPGAPGLTEQTLTKAAVALREARTRKPSDPRVHLYAAEVYWRLGQPSAARAAARLAKALLPDPWVTDDERELLERWSE
jgi:tetratricopeptide (TPR) repeat protein